MKFALQSYIEKIDKMLKRKKYIDSSIIDVHLCKISFFAQERLIHLLVMIFTGLCLFMSLGFLLFSPSISVFLLFSLLFILFIFYLLHYYALENGVQTLYKQYDKMLEKKKSFFQNFKK